MKFNKLRKVLCHEVTHAAMFSYHVNLELSQEELIADLIATYGSSFSEVAWWLSRCSQKVTVVGTRKEWKNGGLPDGVVSNGA